MWHGEIEFCRLYFASLRLCVRKNCHSAILVSLCWNVYNDFYPKDFLCHATPTVYAVGGKQYVVVAAGGGKIGSKSGDAYVAFALPQKN